MTEVTHTMEVHGVKLTGLLAFSNGQGIARLMSPDGKTIRAKSITLAQLLKFARDYENCRPALRTSLWWALLGYDALKWRNAKPLANTECHPGALRV